MFPIYFPLAHFKDFFPTLETLFFFIKSVPLYSLGKKSNKFIICNRDIYLFVYLYIFLFYVYVIKSSKYFQEFLFVYFPPNNSSTCAWYIHKNISNISSFVPHQLFILKLSIQNTHSKLEGESSRKNMWHVTYACDPPKSYYQCTRYIIIDSDLIIPLIPRSHRVLWFDPTIIKIYISSWSIMFSPI